MSEESVFLNRGDIYVSNSRIAIGGTTYATANITSVSKQITPAKTGCALLLIVFGGLGLFGTLVSMGAGQSFGEVVGPLFMTLLFTAAGIAWYRALKPTYHVILASSSGENQALSSQDHNLIIEVVDAINQAMVHRG